MSLLEFDTRNEIESSSGSNLYIKQMKAQAFAHDFVSDVMLPAHSYAGKASCGKRKIKGCLNHQLHVDGCMYCKKVIQHCNSTACNTCFEHTIKTRARNVSDRMVTFANLKKNRRIYMEENRVRVLSHVGVFVPESEHYLFTTKEGRKKLAKKQRDILKKFDIDGGVTIAHPYRFTDGLKSAYFSPHYHNIITGWIDGQMASEVKAETGWIVKQISTFDNDKQCYNVVKYLLSHAAVYAKAPLRRSTEHAISYFGECNNRKFKTESILKFSDTGYDQLSKIFKSRETKTIKKIVRFSKCPFPKLTIVKQIECKLQYVNSDYYNIDDSIKKSVGKFQNYVGLNTDELVKEFSKYITPLRQLSLDKPATTESDPFEFIQMRLDYGDSKYNIVQSEYVNIILNHNLQSICPDCTQKLVTLVPSQQLLEYHQSEFTKLFKNMPDDTIVRLDDNSICLEPLAVFSNFVGMPYIDDDGIWNYESGVYEKPHNFDVLSSKLQDNIEQNITVQTKKFSYKLQHGNSISKEELEDAIESMKVIPFKTAEHCKKIGDYV